MSSVASLSREEPGILFDVSGGVAPPHAPRHRTHETLVETLQEILDSVKWRHSHIKNMIEWKKFTSGV
ncbi:hypothetical protein EBX93_12305 [bacterium]|nr:hypothetical protein [bacterium]